MEIKNKIVDFEEISRGEYRRLKQYDPKNFHGYTARVLFKYFRKKQKFPIIYENDIFRFLIFDNHIAIDEKSKKIELNFYELSSLPLLIESIEKYKEINKK